MISGPWGASAARRGMIDGKRWTATAGEPQFSAPSNQAPVEAPHRACQEPCPRTAPGAVKHALWVLVSAPQLEDQASVEELDLRHDHRDIHNQEERVGTRTSGASSSSSFSSSSSKNRTKRTGRAYSGTQRSFARTTPEALSPSSPSPPPSAREPS